MDTGLNSGCGAATPGPLLVAGVPEVRNYRLRFWDKGTPNGDWTAPAPVTVGP